MIRSWNRIDPRSRSCSKQKSLTFLNFPKINKQLSQREEELSARVSSVPVFLTRSTKQPARGRNYRGNAARFQAIRAPLRRETMNNGTSRFAQLNASVRIRERWNSRRSSGSHKRERSGRSYLPGSIASHLPLRESVELVIDILGEVGGIEKFRVTTWSRMRETIVRPRHFFLSTSLGSCYLRGPVISRWID